MYLNRAVTGRTLVYSDINNSNDGNNDVGSYNFVDTRVFLSEACLQLYSHYYLLICNMHKWGPYNNVVDKSVVQFIGLPLLLFSAVQKGESVIHATTVSGFPLDHQESWSPTSCENNKDYIVFDKYLGFVTEPTMYYNLPVQLPLDINNHESYLQAVDLISASGHPNYKAVTIPLRSAFD